MSKTSKNFQIVSKNEGKCRKLLIVSCSLGDSLEKTNPISVLPQRTPRSPSGWKNKANCRPSAGNPKHEFLNLKQTTTLQNKANSCENTFAQNKANLPQVSAGQYRTTPCMPYGRHPQGEGPVCTGCRILRVFVDLRPRI